MNKNKGFVNMIVLVFFLIVVATGAGYYFVKKPILNNEPIGVLPKNLNNGNQVNVSDIQNNTTTKKSIIYKQSTDIKDPSDPTGNTHIYTSYNLGIKFKYPFCNITYYQIIEGNCFFVSGQIKYPIPYYEVIETEKSVMLKNDESSVSVYEKDPSISLRSAVAKLTKFDENLLGQKCFLVDFPLSSVDLDLFGSMIAFNVSDEDVEKEMQSLGIENAGAISSVRRSLINQYCPNGFNNGHSFFFSHNNVPNKLLYIIRQSSIQSFDEVVVAPYPENKIWYDTIEFINQETGEIIK